GNVGPQPLLDGPREHGFELIDNLIRALAAEQAKTVLLLAAVGKIDLPVGAFLDAWSASAAAGLDGQAMARQQDLHAFKAGDRSRQREEGEDMVDAARIGSRLDQPAGEQRLYLRSEEEPIAGRRRLPGPVEGTDAEAIASQEQAMPALVPQGESELAAQV